MILLIDSSITVADPEISKRGGTDRMLYTPLTAHARAKLHTQYDSAGKRGGGGGGGGGARAPCALCWIRHCIKNLPLFHTSISNLQTSILSFVDFHCKLNQSGSN